MSNAVHEDSIEADHITLPHQFAVGIEVEVERASLAAVEFDRAPLAAG